MNMKKILSLLVGLSILALAAFLAFWLYAFPKATSITPAHNSKSVDADNAIIEIDFDRPLTEAEYGAFRFTSDPSFTSTTELKGEKIIITPVVGLRDEAKYEISFYMKKLGLEKSLGKVMFESIDKSKDAIFLRSLPKSYPGFTITQLSQFTVYVDVTGPSRSKAIQEAKKVLNAAEITEARYRIVFEEETDPSLDSDNVVH